MEKFTPLAEVNNLLLSLPSSDLEPLIQMAAKPPRSLVSQ